MAAVSLKSRQTGRRKISRLHCRVGVMLEKLVHTYLNTKFIDIHVRCFTEMLPWIGSSLFTRQSHLLRYQNLSCRKIYPILVKIFEANNLNRIQSNLRCTVKLSHFSCFPYYLCFYIFVCSFFTLYQYSSMNLKLNTPSFISNNRA